jgi:hypothetical protein
MCFEFFITLHSHTGGYRMTDQSLRIIEHDSGKYSVDIDSIACGLHAGEAPEDFVMIADGAFVYLFRPPNNGAEHQKAKNALDGCPYYAIGNDG